MIFVFGQLEFAMVILFYIPFGLRRAKGSSSQGQTDIPLFSRSLDSNVLTNNQACGCHVILLLLL